MVLLVVEYANMIRILHGSFAAYLLWRNSKFIEYTYYIYTYCVNEQMEYLTSLSS